MWTAVAVLRNRPMSISKSSPHHGWPDVVSIYTLVLLRWVSFLVLTKGTVVAVAQNPVRIISILPLLLVSLLGPTARGINRALISPVLLSSGPLISPLLWQGDSRVAVPAHFSRSLASLLSRAYQAFVTTIFFSEAACVSCDLWADSPWSMCSAQCSRPAAAHGIVNPHTFMRCAPPSQAHPFLILFCPPGYSYSVSFADSSSSPAASLLLGFFSSLPFSKCWDFILFLPPTVFHLSMLEFFWVQLYGALHSFTNYGLDNFCIQLSQSMSLIRVFSIYSYKNS